LPKDLGLRAQALILEDFRDNPLYQAMKVI
jgi:hypothetical protein